MRNQQLQQNLSRSHYSVDLFRQYRKHLGPLRYKVLVESQLLVVPKIVAEIGRLGTFSAFKALLVTYKWMRKIHLDKIIKTILLPSKYKSQIYALDVVATPQKAVAKCPFRKFT